MFIVCSCHGTVGVMLNLQFISTVKVTEYLGWTGSVLFFSPPKTLFQDLFMCDVCLVWVDIPTHFLRCSIRFEPAL